MTVSRSLQLFMLLVFAVLVGVSAPHVQFQIERLLSSVDPHAAVDLRFRLEETAAWWAGERVYREFANAVYPPHAYLVLRGLVVDTDLGVARLAWAVQMLLLLGMACVAFARLGGGREPLARLFGASVPLLIAATWQGLGNGQLHLLPMAAGITAVFLAARGGSLGRDVTAALLMVVALSKPTVSLPLLVLLGILPGRVRPLLLTGGLLTLATGAASALQPDGVMTLLTDFLERAVTGSEHGALHGGTANVMTWIGESAGPYASGAAALGLLAAFGVWASMRTTADRLALIGVACIVARLMVYHRPYDDVLILPALLVLLRAAPKSPTALVALILSVGALAIPGPPVTSQGWIDGVRGMLGWVFVVDGVLLVWLVERGRARG